MAHFEWHISDVDWVSEEDSVNTSVKPFIIHSRRVVLRMIAYLHMTPPEEVLHTILTSSAVWISIHMLRTPVMPTQ